MNKRTYKPSVLAETENKIEKEQPEAWAIGKIGYGEEGSFHRGPFFSEEEALECIPEDDDQAIYCILPNGTNALSWVWKGNYWEKV